jgi:signal transduction histidine kinase/streptogramin lyase
VWVASTTGLAAVADGETRLFTTRDGVPDDWIHALDRDPEGGLWIGTHQGGAAYLPDAGVAHYTRRSGLGDGHAIKLAGAGPEPDLVTTEVSGIFLLGNRTATLVPGSDRPPFDRIQYNIVRDRGGEWWLAASDGVYHVGGEKLELERAQRVDAASGLPRGANFVIGLDPEGRALISNSEGGLYAGSGGTQVTLLPFTAPSATIRVIAWLPDGRAWYSDHLALWRGRDSAVQEFEPWPGAKSECMPRVMRVDSRGWLWIGTRFGGVVFVRDPAAEHPVFERLTTREGLASNAVFALAEDWNGFMYFGTGHGVQRYSTRDRTLETVGADDGLAGEWINDLVFDADGDLWVAAVNGVARIRPDPLHVWRAPPRARFMRCVVAGAEVALPVGGTFEPPAIEVAARDSRLAFDFAAVDPVRGGRLLYETRLEPLESAWSGARPERAVRYGGLAPGAYRLAVRSVDPNASEASVPTFVAITVTPPLWAQGWFIAALVCGAFGLGFALHRLRVRRQLALERVRTQIARDLHDDIGAGLAQIAISSEIARRSTSGEANETLREIAEVARGTRASMSDIVWAVDPRHDTLADVVTRMRQFANDLLMQATTSVAIDVPDDETIRGVVFAADRRRNLFLFFKEALTNVARHARAERVGIQLAVRDGRLNLVIEDDGVGFEHGTRPGGNGLANLERRARDLGGALTIDSRPGRGTRIVLDAPIRSGSA